MTSALANAHGVLAIVGSVRVPSFTRVLVRDVARSLDDRGLRVTTWDLLQRPLPIADPAYHAVPGDAPDAVVREFVRTATTADGFVLASPIYHNSYTGALKNALDTIAIAQVAYKPVGLLSHGSNRSPQAVDHLRIVVRGLTGIATPTQVCTAADDFEMDPAGSPTRVATPSILTRIERFADEFALFVRTMAALRTAQQ